MALHSPTFSWMAEEVLKLADEFSEGRVVATHEGGYSEVYVPFCGLVVLEAFAGKSSGIKDSIVEESQAMTRRDQTLLPHQKEMIDECKKTHNL
jgi:acetoin utilization deacetylase AcuC-like enzyme